MEAIITWRPISGVRNDDILALSIPGGKDVELKVHGVCTESKVAILEKKLDFGTMAVGIKQEKVREQAGSKRSALDIIRTSP